MARDLVDANCEMCNSNDCEGVDILALAGTKEYSRLITVATRSAISPSSHQLVAASRGGYSFGMHKSHLTAVNVEKK